MKKQLTIGLLSMMLFTGMSTFNGETVQAESIQEMEQQKDELMNRSSELQGTIQEKNQKLNSLEEEKAMLKGEVATLQKSIDELVVKLAEQQAKLDETIEKIEKLQVEIEQLKEQIAQREEKLKTQARAVQTQGSNSNMIDMVLSAESLSDLIGRVGVISQLVSANKAIVVEQEEDKAQLEENERVVQEEKAAIEKIKVEMEVDRNNLVAQKAELDDKIIQVAEMYEMTEQEKASFVQEQQTVAQQTSTLNSKMQKEEERILAEQRAKQAAAEKAAAEQAKKDAAQNAQVSNSTSSSSSSNTSSSRGFIRPSRGYKTSDYGYRTHPVTGGKKLHAGLDIGGGGPIVASKAGTVVTAAYHSGWGNYVKIDHGDGYQTLYAHMRSGSLAVTPGQRVSQGQQLGIMGTTGTSTGVHLHFEIYKNGRTVNPASYIGM